MNGPEHYREAQRLIASAAFRDDDGQITTHGDGTPMVRADIEDALALAQVHATLALAAATVQTQIDAYTGSDEDVRDWAEATAPVGTS